VTLRICIVVPVYNHAAGAKTLIANLEQRGLNTILVNDGSAPPQAAVLRDLAAAHDWVRVVEHAENRGKGAAVQTGLREASARGFTHALQIDADGQHDTGDIPAMLALAERYPDSVIAGQPIYDESVPRGRLIARYLTHVWVWIETLSFAIRDSMCGFRVYPLHRVMPLLERTRLGARMDFDPEVLVRLSWLETPIISMPTRVTYPEGGLSHFRLFEDNLLITRMHVRLVFGMLWRLPTLLARKFTSAPTPRQSEAGPGR
jgi:glycosyltransferase involved in cell wall biosynthesis